MTRGTMKLGESTVVGKMLEDNGNTYDFLPDGVKDRWASNLFNRSDGWVFEPDPINLPTKVGALIQIPGHIPFVRSADHDGGWMVTRPGGAVFTDAGVIKKIEVRNNEYTVLFEGVDD